MITPEQEKWLAHLDDTDSIEIFPYDVSAEEKFEIIKKKLVSILGENVIVLHRGSSGLRISGQREIDVYIPVPQENFNTSVVSLEVVFGKPRSNYPLERVCFTHKIENTKIEIFVINSENRGWKDCCRFENYLKEHREALDAYRILKEEGRGFSTRAYYRRKIEFINSILSK